MLTISYICDLQNENISPYHALVLYLDSSEPVKPIRVELICIVPVFCRCYLTVLT